MLRYLPAVLLSCPLASGCAITGQDAVVVRVGETQRSYLEHVPAKLDREQAAPLLLAFHGGGGSAAKGKRAFGLDAVADLNAFLVAYPEGIDGHWNDGRGGEMFEDQDRARDDVAYAMAVVADMQRRHKVDSRRIYAVGVSNGGMFVQRLAIEESETFAAVASIISSIPEPLGTPFEPTRSVSVLFMNGTEDPLVPYAGGEVVVDLFPRLGRKQKSRGRVLATEAAVSLWVKHNGLKDKPHVKELPNWNKRDGARIELHTWTSADSECEVALYKVVGGGHNLPGAKQYLPVRVIGRTCGDINAARTVWRFLASKRRVDME